MDIKRCTVGHSLLQRRDCASQPYRNPSAPKACLRCGPQLLDDNLLPRKQFHQVAVGWAVRCIGKQARLSGLPDAACRMRACGASRGP